MSIHMKNIFKNFFKKFNKNYQDEYLINRELSYFTQCKKILDIGCGHGNFIMLDPKRIVGIDANRDTVKECKKKSLQVFHAKATEIPFTDESFDGIHCAHVIEHLYPNEAHAMLLEVGRVLKKGGIFVLSTPLLWEGFYNDFTHIKPYNPESIIRYLCQEGKQKTYSSIPYQFSIVQLYWRYRPLPLKGKIGYLIANYLYQFNVHHYKKDAYTLVLRKL